MNHSSSDSSGKLIEQGINLAHQGRLPEALLLYNELTPLVSNDPAALARLGDFCLLLNKPVEAINVCSQALTLASNDVSALITIGQAYIVQQQYPEAEYFLLRAYQLNDKNPTLLIQLGSVQNVLGHYAEALKVLEHLLSVKPSTKDLYRQLAISYSATNQLEKAQQFAEKALQKSPKDADTLYAAGKIFLECGELDTGLQYLEKAVLCNPGHGGAYQQIAMAKKFSHKDLAKVQRIEQVLQQQLAPAQRANIHYALGKIYDDLSEPDQAFLHFSKGNILTRPANKPSPPESTFRQMREFFSGLSFSEIAPFANPTETPVFIVGTPRSGSTLVEKILSCHSQIGTAGERSEIGRIADQLRYPQSAFNPAEQDWMHFLTQAKSLGENHLLKLQSIGNARNRIIDKQPGNYFYLGLIYLLFPNAHVIHTTRHPLDACLSCYFQNFEHVVWSTDLSWIGEHYCFYRDVMAYWQKTLPSEKIISVAYEELIKDPETHSRRLIESLGLDWEPACLDFYQQKRAVRTASLWQVQQPIYQRSRGRWEAYAPHLAVLARKIAPYLTPEDIEIFLQHGISLKPTVFEAIRLWLRHLLRH